MAKKAPRDPNAPKRNMSTYLLYQNAMREQFKALNPGMTFGQLAKYTSAMYAEMAPPEKEAWVARAEADKARYLHELSTYVPPPGFDAKGDAIMAAIPIGVNGILSGGPTITMKGKIGKDVNAPKRNVSAYLIYQNGMREHFKQENPGMTFGQLAKYTSHMYKNLTVEEKASWSARAQLDKQRYEQQMAQYVPPPGHDAKGYVLQDHLPKKRGKRAPKDPNAPKRSSGAYVFFTNEMRPVITQQFPNIKFVEMGRVLGERWRALTPEEKKKFEEIAAQDKIRFQVEMQQYTANQQAQQQQNAALQAQAQQQHPPVPQQHYIPTPAPSGTDATAVPQHNQYGLDPQQYQHYDAYGQPQYHQ